ncbi:hypothetical protein BDV10DRAFT_160407 [Aspergillus recurvatus]
MPRAAPDSALTLYLYSVNNSIGWEHWISVGSLDTEESYRNILLASCFFAFACCWCVGLRV